jgi:hypothetical protein
MKGTLKVKFLSNHNKTTVWVVFTILKEYLTFSDKDVLKEEAGGRLELPEVFLKKPIIYCNLPVHFSLLHQRPDRDRFF